MNIRRCEPVIFTTAVIVIPHTRTIPNRCTKLASFDLERKKNDQKYSIHFQSSERFAYFPCKVGELRYRSVFYGK